MEIMLHAVNDTTENMYRMSYLKESLGHKIREKFHFLLLSLKKYFETF